MDLFKDLESMANNLISLAEEHYQICIIAVVGVILFVGWKLLW